MFIGSFPTMAKNNGKSLPRVHSTYDRGRYRDSPAIGSLGDSEIVAKTSKKRPTVRMRSDLKALLRDARKAAEDKEGTRASCPRLHHRIWWPCRRVNSSCVSQYALEAGSMT